MSIILILPLLLVACSNSSPPEELDNEYLNSPLDIRFHSSIMGMTRSNTYQPDLSNLASFKVAAFTHTSNPETFFPPMDVMQQADGTWLNSTTYYWPSQPLQFYAYAPSDLPFIVTSEAQLLTDYSVADSAAHQKDIITAWGHGKRSDFRETNDSIPLFFRHAMAIIEVRASNPSDNRVDILGVKICRIPSTGTLTMQQSENAFPSWTVKSNSRLVACRLH